jgi:glycerate kinase
LLEGCTIVTSSTDRTAQVAPRSAPRGNLASPRGNQPPPWRAAHGAGISQRLLVACAPFGPRLSAVVAAGSIARGLTEGGLAEPDVCPLPIVGREGNVDEVRAMLDALDFDARMRGARAVVVGAPRLEERTLAGSVTFEIATRARQSGVPAYAVTGDDALDAFDARILDLQVVLQARSRRALEAAGLALARLA